MLLTPSVGQAAELYATFPSLIHPNERYVVFSHGLIAEGEDPLREAIFKDGGFNLIAQQRPKNADAITYVGILESWVRRLLKAGVPASRVTIVGFSRGSYITALAAGRLRDTGIHTALLGACANGDMPGNGEPLVLGGNVLNIYETTGRGARLRSARQTQQALLVQGSRHHDRKEAWRVLSAETGVDRAVESLDSGDEPVSASSSSSTSPASRRP